MDFSNMPQDEFDALYAEMTVLEGQLDCRCPFCYGTGVAPDEDIWIPCHECSDGTSEHWLYTIRSSDSLSETASNLVKLANWKGRSVATGMGGPDDVIVSPGDSAEEILHKLQESDQTESSS